MANELKSEKSPYLKQHKDNPVEWLAWNKNSLLKIGSFLARLDNALDGFDHEAGHRNFRTLIKEVEKCRTI